MALLKKFGKEKEGELEKELKSLNLRKAAVLSSIESEITKIQSEIDSIYLEAGKHVCNVWMEKGEKADIETYCEKVRELNQNVKEWEDKRTEMTKRFDEEIELINPNHSIKVSVNSIASDGKVVDNVCPGCGASITPDDMFCQECGTKLR